MKKMMLTLIAAFAIAISSNAMSYEQARNEALFLTDKMAYELNLTDAQYEAAYEINLDYLMSVSSRHDVFGSYWERRNLDLQYILYSWQWEALRAASYFYRPLYWNAGYWHFGIYARYPHRNYFYFGRPHFYASYRGGHSWRLNGGRSYYEHHRHHYSPSIAREHHSGMRDSWNRGNYRTQHGHNSSTRITGNGGRHEQGNHSGVNGRPSGSSYDNHSGVNNRRSGSSHDNHSGMSNRPVGNSMNARPSEGTSARPSEGTSARPSASISARPSASSSARPSGTVSTRSSSSITHRAAGNSMNDRATRGMSTTQRSSSVSTMQRSSAPSSSRGSFSAPQRSGSSSAGSHSPSGGSRGGHSGSRSGGRR